MINRPVLPRPPPTPAEIALHFDTLAGALEASSPSDVRLTWYQDIASIVALDVAPTNLTTRIQGSPAIFEAVTEVDAFADTVNGKVTDSTYRLAAWAPSNRPSLFVDLRVRFLPAGAGKPDTTATYLKFYTDTLGTIAVDSTQTVVLQVQNARGLCQATPLQHLTVPSNPCTKVAVDWLVGGATAIVNISPAALISGTHLTR